MKTKKILSKDRVRSEKGSGKQAKRWRNAGHEHIPTNELARPRSAPQPIGKQVRRGIKSAAQTPP
jgi:hypothetical protein